MPNRVRTHMTFANVVSLLALSVALGAGSYAVGAIPGKDGKITACYQKTRGTLRVIDTNKKKCSKRERTLTWSQKGPAGQQGPLGQQGPAGQKGDKGDQGAAGSPGGQVSKISYLADIGSATTTIYENSDFRITAACNNTTGPNAIMRPKADHGAWTQSVSASNTTSALYSQVPDTNVASPTLIQFFNLPEEAGTITYVSPAGARITTITYLVNYLFATRDCVFAGTAVTV
jgi:hypothetical protein